MALAALAWTYGSPPRSPQHLKQQAAVSASAPRSILIGRTTQRSTSSSDQGSLGFVLQVSSVVALGVAAGRRPRKAHTRRHQSHLRACGNQGGCDCNTDKAISDIEKPPEDLQEQRIEAQKKSVASGASWPSPVNDRLLRAARGEHVDRPPKWMMRQAGRYLPEYRSVLKQSDFFSVCHSPALAAEITLQPYWRYRSLDSLIIFSDILVIPVAMGMACRMEADIGPQFDFALNTPEDMQRLNFTPDVEKTLGFVFDAIFWTRQRVQNEIPVIGFSGAPWTLMGYMVEGGASRSFDRAKQWLYLYPKESRQLLRSLRNIVVDYLVGQYDAGAPLLQVFDTNTGEIPPAVYEEFCVPDLKFIAEEVKRRRPDALMSIFPKDGELSHFNDSAYDVVGVGWKTSPKEARRQCPDKTLQGNLDPHLLYADPAVIAATTQRMVNEFGVDKYIANLGHGMMPSHPTAGPKAFIDAVDEFAK